MKDLQQLRIEMVERQVLDRGIVDDLVIEAMRIVPRELFVGADLRGEAYDDMPLPIGSRQTISQPYTVAFMIAAMQLRGGEKVLEIGAGSGYAAAVLAEIAGPVHAIERVESLTEQAIANLAAAGYSAVRVRQADGTQGWPEQAPFDAILVSAGAPAIPQSLKQQLTIGGRMIVPVGDDLIKQVLIRVTRAGEGEYREERLGDVRFVPLVGQEGWEHEDIRWYQWLVERVAGPIV